MADVPAMHDQGYTRQQYAEPDRLRTRAGFWDTPAPGRSPQDHAIAALAAAAPGCVLEVGCGTGEFALRVAREVTPDVTPTDPSEAMVRATSQRGLRAEVADATDLPYRDDSFDAVVAMWMLYHVPDLDRALAEGRRVLRPGGLFVAVTNGAAHTADLRTAAGLPAPRTQFMAEDGAAHLRRHFGRVETIRTAGRATVDHATAAAYLDTLVPGAGARLPAYDGTRTFTGDSAVFLVR